MTSLWLAPGARAMIKSLLGRARTLLVNSRHSFARLGRHPRNGTFITAAFPRPDRTLDA